MDKYLLDYDGTLFLEIPENEIEKFVSGAFYKDENFDYKTAKRYMKNANFKKLLTLLLFFIVHLKKCC